MHITRNSEDYLVGKMPKPPLFAASPIDLSRY